MSLRFAIFAMMQESLDEIPVETLQGERIVLRALTEDDFEPLYALIDENREFLSRHLPWPPECRSAEDVAARVDSWELQSEMGNGGCWGVFVEDASGAPVIAGCIFIGWVQWAHRSASVSYWLGRPFTGRGLATEALRLLSRFALTRLGLNRLELSVSVNNPESAAVACRSGFLEEGLCREYERINGNFEDHRRFALLARDLTL